MLRIALVGLWGRLGQSIARQAALEEGVEIALGVVRSTASRPQSALTPPRLATMEDVTWVDASGAPLVDVVIDTSAPAQADRLVQTLGPAGLPLVVCSTGLDDRAVAALQTYAGSCTLVLAPNAGLGANLLFHLAAAAAAALPRPPRLGIEIIETHHRHKRDTPSGTARRLVEVVAAALGLDPAAAVHGEGVPPTDERPIGLHSLRLGEVVGEHRVLLTTDTEEVELVHRARSRQSFAEGALRAARFAAEAPPGCYDMAQVLGLTAPGED